MRGFTLALLLTLIPPTQIGKTPRLADDAVWVQGAPAAVLDLAPDPVVVDVMLIISDDVAADPDVLAGAVIEFANDSLANSGVEHRFRLTHHEVVEYDESGSANFDLQALTQNGEGLLDEVHELRERYGADLVTLVVEDLDFAGIGWLPSTISPDNRGYGFSVVSRVGVTQLSTHHEWGHNLGLAHDRPNASVSPALPYGYGWSVAQQFRTVMAYPCAAPCPRIKHYSSPAVSFGGVPTGTPDDDAAAALTVAMPIVAQYFDAVPAFTWTDTQTASEVCSGDPNQGVILEGTLFEFQNEAAERNRVGPEDAPPLFGWTVTDQGYEQVTVAGECRITAWVTIGRDWPN